MSFQVTITLTDAQKVGMDLYAEKNGDASAEESIQKICEQQADSSLKQAYLASHRDRSPEEMAEELSS